VSTDDKCILTHRLGSQRSIWTVSKPDRCWRILLPISHGKLGQAAIAKCFNHTLPDTGPVIGSDYHTAVIGGAGGCLTAANHRRRMGQLSQHNVMRFTIHCECLVDLVRQQPAAVANVYRSLYTSQSSNIICQPTASNCSKCLTRCTILDTKCDVHVNAQINSKLKIHTTRFVQDIFQIWFEIYFQKISDLQYKQSLKFAKWPGDLNHFSRKSDIRPYDLI